jgi:pyridoxamine 5'-phosphate oxidase
MDLFKKAEAELLRSNKDRKHLFRFAQMATMGEPFPEVRTVVKRQMDSDWQFLFYTDLRTPKVAEIKSNKSVSLHFYDPKKQLQIRIRAKAEILESGDLFEEHLKRVQSAPSVSDYTAIQAPSSELEGALEYGEKLYFGLIQVDSQEVDILQLSRAGHQRILAIKTGSTWSFRKLVP